MERVNIPYGLEIQFATKIVNSILFKMLQSGYIGVDEYLASIESHFSWEQYEKPEIGTEESINENTNTEGEASSLDF